ncbi:DUF4870 domain-containing protein [Actinoplanes sp. NPDC024001]|uniref:DUF4870 domain-containing protein n=1 Tax=Actinoplanes sp. NPDC024001 TaxID=3154598 RepID=UPI0033D5EB0D
MNETQDRNWIVMTHVLAALGAFVSSGTAGWIAPLVTFLARGDRSPAVRAEAVQALNFQILWAIVTLAGYAAVCILIGWLVVGVAWLIAWIVPVVAAVRAMNGEPFRYPMTAGFIK